MRYKVKELLRGPERLEDSRDLEIRECKDMDEAVALVKEMEAKGFELKARQPIKDYEKTILVELYFKHKNT